MVKEEFFRQNTPIKTINPQYLKTGSECINKTEYMYYKSLTMKMSTGLFLAKVYNWI